LSDLPSYNPLAVHRFGSSHTWNRKCYTCYGAKPPIHAILSIR
jgi:hypothetical protein